MLNNIKKLFNKTILKCFVVVNVIVLICFNSKMVHSSEKKIDNEAIVVSNIVNQKNDENFNLNSSDVGINAQKGAILIDARTNDVLYANNANIVAEMASTTKIMTAILAIENIEDFDTYYEVNEEAINVEGSSMNLAKGDSVNMKGLLVGLMLASGNDAANEIAIRVIKELIKNKKISPLCDDEEKIDVKKYIAKFVELMNEKAKELNLNSTKFSSSSGLGPKDVSYSKEFKENCTNAKDLAFLASYAMKNDLFRELCGSYRDSIEIKKTVNSKEYNPNRTKEKRFYINHNKMLNKKTQHYYSLACGVKTGFTKEAGKCLVSAAEKNGVKLIAVVLNDRECYADCRALLEYGFRKYKKFNVLKILRDEDKFEDKEFKVIGMDGEDKFFKVIPKEKIEISLTNDMRKNKKIKAYIKCNVIYFNVKKGEKVGEMECYMDDIFLGKTDLLADRDVLDWEFLQYQLKLTKSFIL